MAQETQKTGIAKKFGIKCPKSPGLNVQMVETEGPRNSISMKKKGGNGKKQSKHLTIEKRKKVEIFPK